MNPLNISKHIDNKVLLNLKCNLDILKAIDQLILMSENFKKRSYYLDLTEDYIIANWNNIPIKTRYSTYYVISCINRINGIKWILSKDFQIDDINKYKLVILKAKIEYEY